MTRPDSTNDNETNYQPDDAIAILTADHRQVRALFQQYEDTPDPYLKQIIAEHVFAELTLHMLLEESVFYPVFAEQADEEGKELVLSQDDFFCSHGQPKKPSDLRAAAKIVCDKMNLTMH